MFVLEGHRQGIDKLLHLENIFKNVIFLIQ
jgi:hypothetical protein